MTEPDHTEQSNEREQASAALSAAIVRMSAALGLENTARVLASLGANLQEESTTRSADVLAADKARRAGGLH